MLFALVCGATLTIAAPRAAPAYEIAIFLLAAYAVVSRAPLAVTRLEAAFFSVSAAIALYGFAQLIAGATVYRWATLDASLRYAALAATAAAACLILHDASARARFLDALVWFGVTLSVVSVLAYYTSPGRILWIFPAAYPDNWGPFPSRNNFAQFLELCLPVALTRANVIAPALILAAGLASSSRAGAALLVLETIAAIVLLRRGPRRWLMFTAAAVLCTGLAGAGTLWHRLSDRDPLEYRREIFRSTVAMIAQRPWRGYGLGTYATVYPQFATFDSGASVEHAHNDWLEWTAEGGLPFAALWLLLAACVARDAVGSVWGLGVLAVFLHALVDYPFARFGVSAWVFALAGALLAQGRAGNACFAQRRQNARKA